MMRITVAAATSLGLTAILNPSASAQTLQECQEQVEETCALFVPRGSANWAACVETLLPIDCAQFFGAPISLEDLNTRLNDEPA